MKERFLIFRLRSTPGRSLLPGVCAKACAREVHERARTVTVKREAMNFLKRGFKAAKTAVGAIFGVRVFLTLPPRLTPVPRARR